MQVIRTTTHLDRLSCREAIILIDSPVVSRAWRDFTAKCQPDGHCRCIVLRMTFMHSTSPYPSLIVDSAHFLTKMTDVYSVTRIRRRQFMLLRRSSCYESESTEAHRKERSTHSHYLDVHFLHKKSTVNFMNMRSGICQYRSSSNFTVFTDQLVGETCSTFQFM